MLGDFPGAPAIKTPPPSAEDAGSTPGWGTNIPYAMKQLRPPHRQINKSVFLKKNKNAHFNVAPKSKGNNLNIHHF